MAGKVIIYRTDVLRYDLCVGHFPFNCMGKKLPAGQFFFNEIVLITDKYLAWASGKSARTCGALTKDSFMAEDN